MGRNDVYDTFVIIMRLLRGNYGVILAFYIAPVNKRTRWDNITNKHHLNYFETVARVLCV
jgi:hypothetical protein